MGRQQKASARLMAQVGPALFESAPWLVAMVDREYNILAANRVFVQTFGEPGGRTCFSACHHRESPCEACPAQRVFAGDEAVPYMTDGLTPADKTIELGGVACGLRDSHDQVSAVLLLAEDRTRLHELEGSFAQVERLAHAGLSAAGLAHTIKNILLGLDGALYMVDSAMAKNDGARLTHGWQMVKGYLTQVTGLVGNLLEFARPRERTRELVVPAELVDEVVGLHRAKAAASAIALSVRHAPEVAPVWMDRPAIHTSLSNLLSNAIDACTWDPDTDKEHQIELVTTPVSGGGVRFAVTDNGSGISTANQRRLLRTFFTTKGIRGTGLGLLLTKKAMEDHGGSIDFTSTPGQGSEFRLALPKGHGDAPRG